MKKTTKMRENKNLYKGIFNWYGELHILYTYAKDENKAFNNFIASLIKTLKTSRGRVHYYFTDEEKDNFKIVKEGEGGDNL